MFRCTWWLTGKCDDDRAHVQRDEQDGGADKDGWEIGEDITLSDLFECIQPDPEVGFISEITIEAGKPLYQPPDRPYESKPGVWVQVADYEVICNGADHDIEAKFLQE